MTTQSQALVTVSLNGRDLGTWRMTGDYEITSDSTKRLQPGGGYKSYGTRRKLGTLEVTRDYDVPEVSDYWDYVESLEGVGTLTVAETILGDDFTSTGRRRIYQGRMIRTMLSGTDIEGNEVRTVSVTCDVEG